MFLFLTRDSFAPLAFALVFLLTSCVHFHPKPLSAEVGAATLSERSLNDPRFRAVLNASSGKAHASWGFDQLVIAALYFNPQLNESRSQSAVAAAGKITAGERPNPTLSFAPENVTRTTIFPWVLGGSFDVPIETAGKRRFRLA